MTTTTAFDAKECAKRLADVRALLNALSSNIVPRQHVSWDTAINDLMTVESVLQNYADAERAKEKEQLNDDHDGHRAAGAE